jgi:monoamine oxidase
MLMVKVDVVIIGAGASGLQCASTLLQSARKPSFVILEARDRIGGRIHTITESVREVSSNTHVTFPRDLGAAWLHGTGHNDDPVEQRNPMIPLLRETTPEGMSVAEFHLSPIFEGNAWTRPDTMLHKANKIALFHDGKIIPNDSPQVMKAIKAHYEISRAIAQYGEDLFEIGEGMQTVFTSMEEARATILAESDASDNDSIGGDLVPFYAFLSDNWNGLSACDLQLSSCSIEAPMVTDEIYEGRGDYDGPHCKLKHGMERVVEPLYQRVADRIFLNEEVVRVTRREGQNLAVETRSGTVIESKCCISTLPVGCLQKTARGIFQPQLAEETTEAIDAMAPGSYKKVFLTFDEIFWSVKEPLIGLIRNKDLADELGQYLLVYNFWAKDCIPCLEAVLSGNSGKWALGRSDEEIRDAVLRFVQDSLGVHDLDKRLSSCHITRWEEDPFTYGSYTSFCLGTLERHIDVLQRPQWDGDLIIAGEFTESDHQGSVHAALMSGSRAAAQALSVLEQSNRVRAPASAPLIRSNEGFLSVA